MIIDPATSKPPSGAPRRTAATLLDVARAAGVSKASASRALDPASQYVSPELRARVVEAANRLGYQPNASARATTTGTAAVVVVLVSDIRDPYNAEIVHGVIEQANRAGLVATFAGTDSAIDDEIRVVRMMRGLRPHAMILTGARSGSTVSRTSLQEELARYTSDDGRVVIAGDDELPFDTVVVPRRVGAAALVAALFDLGYRSPAMILPEHDSVAAREWEAGVVEGARGLGLRFGYGAAVRAPVSRDGGYEAAKRLLEDRPEEIDVVLAASDTMAIGAMSAMRDAGMTPGVEIGVAGFDDTVGAEDMTPGLTSVDLSLARAGAAAVELALLRPEEERRTVPLEARVVVRGTTPPRPA
ncbi:LacI family DNA-binding transcriptional regulator [Glycomyces sp. YM15]|uniref:LacI family DNA-binding transcriptional regulator n=1 Tax=Glycomyces sp. YM15 TaxID=2800446 RepID=UPI001962E617|nr:LacI family DNA-binding transcriptional regulator [Glycomyces sp. YM15]